ncbi:hypothetical protein [Marinisporobacter balticus]|uniref:DUF4179 domain-containing protein n=1 Tax=Marinisporobacter balticus TaxID=2018667 RepID=A0A4V2SBZ3_9FIRM|nr:hypothetical protein [Marinisporobacter balticus]TCO77380.1 hypothetical protein EV214_10622 [Marinisporobacter balticus]
MNEDKLIELLSNFDDDLVEKEIDKLLEGVEIDMDSINKKANKKLNDHNEKGKGRKRFPYVAAACVCLLCITTAYADDISGVIKSFFNKTPVYSTIVDGDAYYLKESYPLNKDIQIKNAMVSEGKLEMEVTTSLNLKLEDIKITPKNDPNKVYCVGGYSGEENEYFLSFMNKTEKNYNIKPFKDFNIYIAGDTYDVSLEEAKSLDVEDKIYTGDATENNIEGVNMGAQKLYKNGKVNIQLIAAFDDKDLKLTSLGKPTETKVVSTTENRGKEGIMGSSTSSKAEDLYVFDESNDEYKLEIPKDAKGRPVTTFETNAPKDKNLTLKLPAIIAGYEKTMDSFELNIPKEGEVTLNKEIDFNIQKAVVKNIKRVSPTSAQVELELNTDGDENINIRSFDFYSADMGKIVAEFDGDKGIVNLEFDKNIDTTNIEISYPDFVMNGNWIIDMK